MDETEIRALAARGAMKAVMPRVEMLDANVMAIHDALPWAEEFLLALQGLGRPWLGCPVGQIQALTGVPELKVFDELLEAAVKQGREEYVKQNEYAAWTPFGALSGDNGYRVLRWDANQGYGLACDGRQVVQIDGKPTLVTLIVVGFLNDDFVGGEVFFPRQKLRVRPEAGMLLASPASFTYPHEGVPVRRGTKYSVLTGLY